MKTDAKALGPPSFFRATMVTWRSRHRMPPSSRSSIPSGSSRSSRSSPRTWTRAETAHHFEGVPDRANHLGVFAVFRPMDLRGIRIHDPRVPYRGAASSSSASGLTMLRGRRVPHAPHPAGTRRRRSSGRRWPSSLGNPPSWQGLAPSDVMILMSSPPPRGGQAVSVRRHPRVGLATYLFVAQTADRIFPKDRCARAHAHRPRNGAPDAR